MNEWIAFRGGKLRREAVAYFEVRAPLVQSTVDYPADCCYLEAWFIGGRSIDVWGPGTAAECRGKLDEMTSDPPAVPIPHPFEPDAMIPSLCRRCAWAANHPVHQ